MKGIKSHQFNFLKTTCTTSGPQFENLCVNQSAANSFSKLKRIQREKNIYAWEKVAHTAKRHLKRKGISSRLMAACLISLRSPPPSLSLLADQGSGVDLGGKGAPACPGVPLFGWTQKSSYLPSITTDALKRRPNTIRLTFDHLELVTSISEREYMMKGVLFNTLYTNSAWPPIKYSMKSNNPFGNMLHTVVIASRQRISPTMT